MAAGSLGSQNFTGTVSPAGRENDRAGIAEADALLLQAHPGAQPVAAQIVVEGRLLRIEAIELARVRRRLDAPLVPMSEERRPIHEQRPGAGEQRAQPVEDSKAVRIDVAPVGDGAAVEPPCRREAVDAIAAAEDRKAARHLGQGKERHLVLGDEDAGGLHIEPRKLGYRIDLGVRNADKPTVYLAGIECDGAGYHSSKSARDRDRLRQDCLKKKGWEILRVWSTDWFDDPDGQTDKLASQLEELRRQAAERLRREEMEQELQRSQRVPLSVPEAYGECREAGLPGLAEDDRAAPGYAIGKAAGGRHDTQPAEADRDAIPASAPGPDRPEPPVASPERTRFVPARVADCGIDPNPARFYEGSYRPALKRIVHHVTDAEGPVYQADVVTRIARAHGFQRNGGRIEERVLAAIGPEIPATTEDDGKVVYWPQGREPAPLVPFRRAELHVRGLASIPLAELAGLAKEPLAPGRHDAAVMERMREHFGLGKLRESTRRRLAAAIGIARAHPA